MKIATIKETANYETRVSISPESSKLLRNNGFDVCIEKDAGLLSDFTNEAYLNFAHISSVPLEILADSNIITKVQPPEISGKHNESEFAKSGSIIIGFMNPYQNKEMIKFYANKKITLLAMELVPRITKAQSFDALSSQANLNGYRAVIEAASLLKSAFPMLMTAAGSITPAKVLILGAGVAGLQAIATAKRLGAIVTAYDVRAAAKEQVESLGAKFVHPDVSVDFSAKTGYASEVSGEFAARQEDMLLNIIDKFNIVITTAQIPGKKAPKLITKDMVEKMRYGSVIIDLAADSGGNCEVTSKLKIIEHKGVQVAGFSNYYNKVSNDASRLYSKNIANLILYLFKDKSELDLSDEIVKSMILTHNGEILFNEANV
ncbi:MAG: Re/Si-specific NAD(P)(+) transhydrogenase subunit alpha [Rickettsiaceae bacterium]|nr:Re/Si-specific NAD(P)(+) transhydrogenase subunit alpha [Rickettsiaceae bacterium]